MKKTHFAVLFAVCAAISPGLASADPLSRMRADASALQQMSATWAQIESTSQSYAALAPYAAQEWAGQGPTVVGPFGGIEQCHNTHWDQVTRGLIPGGLNIFGDAEVEAYSMQAITVDFQAQLANYMVQQVQAGNSPAGGNSGPLMNQLAQQNGPLMQSMNTLDGLLTTVGNQVSGATGPSTALHQLPIQHWQAGVGNVPDLASVQYIVGPDDGAPIGWVVPPSSPLARLVDICPTGTGSIPMLQTAAPVLSAAQQAVADEPALASQLQPIEGGSTYTLPGGGMFGSADYIVRMSLVSALASDMQPLAGYMQPISAPLALYQKQVQQIMNEVQ